MIPRSEIKSYCDAIAREFKPEKIILFGSYAYGTPTEDSDVDLMVVMPCKGKPVETACRIRRHLRAPFAMDLLVRTPDFVRARLSTGDAFLREVTVTGEVMYES